MTRIAVLGLGVMGGSLVRALSRAGVPVRCWSPDGDEVSAAAALPGAEAAGSPEAAVQGTTGVVLAVPLSAIRDLLPRMVAAPGWIQDVGSLQGPPLAWAREAGMASRYVTAHPLAGSDASGFAASRDDLYRGAPVFLSGDATPAVRSAVESFWRGMEVEPRWEDPDVHDRRMAWVSHLPQVVATHLAGALAEAEVPATALGPGGRDMTRLAGSSPAMWRDILAHAGPRLAPALRRVADRLMAEAARLDAGDGESHARTLEEARRWRGP